MRKLFLPVCLLLACGEEARQEPLDARPDGGEAGGPDVAGAGAPDDAGSVEVAPVEVEQAPDALPSDVVDARETAADGADAPGSPDAARVVAFRRIVLTTDFISEAASYADFDGDGMTDVVVGPYWYAGPDFSRRFQIFPVTPFDVRGISQSFLVFPRDFSGDGFPDVLVIGPPGHAGMLFDNPRTPGQAWPSHMAVLRVDFESPAFTDLTGDGQPELVHGSEGRLGWSGPGSDPHLPWAFNPVTPGRGYTAYVHGLGVGDFDGDGRPDILEKDGIWRQPTPGGGLFTHLPHKLGSDEGGAQMFAYDVDGDGDNDIVTTMAAHGQGVSWFEQLPGSTLREHVILSATPGPGDPVALCQPHALTTADVDGDGLLDLVSGNRPWGHITACNPRFDDPALLVWFRLERGPAGVRFVPQVIDRASGVGTQVTAGDLDGDRRVDIVVANKKGAFVFLQTP